MDVNEEHVQTLSNMGFPSESEIRRALRLGKNDLNEAVAILTNENPSGSYDSLDDLDVEMKDVESRGTGSGTVYGPSLPPSYEEVVDTTSQAPHSPRAEAEGGQEEGQGDGSLEFPVPNLYELENRVFTESWNIPYKKDESLGKCLVAATRLSQENLTSSDQYCKRFLEKCMPEAFQKLMTSGAVHRWGPEIQEGIYHMLQLLIDLVATQLQHDGVPLEMLNVLTTAFNPETEFHTKNKNRRPDRVYWEDKFGSGQTPGVSPSPGSNKDSYGWLTNLINRFADKKGIEYMKDKLMSENLDAVSMTALLAPFGSCAEFLNARVLNNLLAPGMEKAVKYVQDLTEDDLKDKRMGCVCDMLASMKLLCEHMWPMEVRKIDDLRLEIALRMLKSPHFNAKMNSLKEVTKLIEDSSGTRVVKTAINTDRILDWMVDNKVLSIALEGNIDQMQYCDKIKNIVDFLGANLSVDELTKIWKMQNGETNAVIDNIHSIIAAAGVKFNSQQVEHLVLLIQQSWQVENNRMREKLLSLIGKIGREARIMKITNRILELLWDLAHLPSLKTQLVEQALDEHLAILNDSYTVKEQVKRQYVTKCINDIREGTWVLPALKQLLQIAKNIAKHSFHKAEKGILQELNKNYDIIKQVTNSLTKFHQLAVTQTKSLGPDTLVDGRYTHRDYMNVHLSFLQFILQEGVLYLPWHRARDLWDTLAANPDACHWDNETCFEWFTKGISDLEPETQSQLFTKELLKLDPAKVTEKGFSCFKCFFENVNQYEHKLKRPSMVVEKPDLVGLYYLWEVCLQTPTEAIANTAIHLLMTISYTNLSPRLKKDPLMLHKKFIDECQSRLETAMGGSTLQQILCAATTIITAATMPEVASIPPSRSTNMLNIERLLLIAERYVTTVEDAHSIPRTILSHGASFLGHPLTLTVTCESPKLDCNIKVHSNESVGSVRQKIASKLNQHAEQVQIVANDKMLSPAKDQKLLHQLHFEENQLLSVRVLSSSLASATSSPSTQVKEESTGGMSARQSFDLEQEKMLPGVVMATGGQVFEMLYKLADLDEPKITKRARSLLKLISTDPSVLDSLDSLGQRNMRQSSPEDISPRASPRSSPRRFAPSPTPSMSSLASSSSSTNTKNKPKNLFKSLFDASSSEMTSFRVLYNLEVLSSKLIPTVRDAGMLSSARHFCEEFLNHDGLSLVVNVLQREAIPTEVEYETRQGCYAIALQLLRYLLCGQDPVTGESFLSSGRKASTSSGPGASGGSGPPSLELPPSTAFRAIQTMSVSDFTDMVSCFMRVAWAAAAGKLRLASSAQPVKEGPSIYNLAGSRSRQSSTGSTASTSSEGEQALHAGVCVKQKTVSPKDANIAKEALELLVTCLQLRSPLLATFYNQPCVGDFIIDILVGSAQDEIRDVALDQFYLLSQTEVTPSENCGHQSTPHHFMLQTLLKARLPFWVTSSNTRSAGIRLLRQCSQYFDLRCRLIGYLTLEEQERLQVNIGSMLEDELAWLSNFVPSEHLESRDIDNILLAAHLRLTKTLLTCAGIDKREIGGANTESSQGWNLDSSRRESGGSLIQDLLHEFLFPASKLIMEDCSTLEGENAVMTVTPRCSDSQSRTAAYEVMAELADSCLANLSDICAELIFMHHQTLNSQEWDFMPPVDGRSSANFVGLKNGGATCYMNSVIQQLFMTPGITESILGTDAEDIEEESVFCQLQNVFGHLLESKLQYYVPEKFWRVFKLWGQQVNIREQQDALDFYQAVIDQVDEQLKKVTKEQVFKKKFQGVFSDQKICKDCPHKYEREEVFFALNVTVKNATLQDSLDQYVAGELLEGDNAYFCEKCGEKRNTIKRMCIKTLPPVLCIQLKRFGYDWEANRALKFDDHFKFPWVLDMEPYTAEGMSRRDAQEEDANSDIIEEGSSSPSSCSQEPMQTTPLSASPGGGMTVAIPTHNQINYELVGVCVHSGQANAGHYYSFIKDRRGTHMTNPGRGKWYKFNDTVIEEFEMNDTSLEAECFGGFYKPKTYDTSSTSYTEERLRYWNGYLLFYEKIEEVPRTPMSAKKSKVSMRRTSSHERHGSGSGRSHRDSLVELTELVHKGEKKGLFTDKMPASIQQVVRDENLRFMKNKGVYDNDYFRFIRTLVTKSASQPAVEHYPEMCLQSLQLAIQFLFNTYFRTKKKLRSDMGEWVNGVETLVQRCKEACQWLIEYLSSEQGRVYIKPFLLECPTKEIRIAFAKILERTMASFFHHGGIPTHKCFDELLEILLGMLSKDVPDNIKNCTQYFWVLSMYVQMGTKACSHMFGRNAFSRIVHFLLGNNSASTSTSENEAGQRRWSSIQARDFGPLHSTLATLILNCDVTPHRTDDSGSHPLRNPTTVVPQRYLKMSTEMQSFVYGTESSRYVREVVLALKEVSGTTTHLVDMLLYCSFCNLTFSFSILKNIMLQCASAPANELKPLFSVLHDMLVMEDPLQLKRLQVVIDGYVDDNNTDYEGMLGVIKINHSNDSRRSYQCIKFLVSLASKCGLAKDYLMQAPTKWQWAVNWLKKKMTDDYWHPSSSSVQSNEDSNSRSFQRTISAQDTLAEATALLTELEAQEHSDMETNGDPGEGTSTSDSHTEPEQETEKL